MVYQKFFYQIFISFLGTIILISPILNASYEVWSKTIIHILTIFSCISGIFYFNLKKTEFFLLIFFLWLFLNTKFSQIPFNSRLEFHNWINYIILFLLICSVKDKKKLYKYIYLSIIFLIIYAFYQIFQGKVPSAFLINSNIFADYIILLIPFILKYIIENKQYKSYFNILLFLFLIICLIFTKSISSIMCLMLSFVLINPFGAFKKTKKSRFYIIFISFFIFFLFFGFKIITDPELDNRIRWNISTIYIINDFPLFGSGLGTFEYIYPVYKDTGIGTKFTHNFYGQFCSETGIPGLIIFLAVIIFYFLNIKDKFLKTSILACLINNIFNYNLYIPANSILFWSFLSFGQTEISGGSEFINSFNNRMTLKSFYNNNILKLIIIFLAILIYFNSIYLSYSTIIKSNTENENRLINLINNTNDYWPAYQKLAQINFDKYKKQQKLSYLLESTMYEKFGKMRDGF